MKTTITLILMMVGMTVFSQDVKGLRSFDYKGVFPWMGFTYEMKVGSDAEGMMIINNIYYENEFELHNSTSYANIPFFDMVRMSEREFVFIFLMEYLNGQKVVVVSYCPQKRMSKKNGMYYFSNKMSKSIWYDRETDSLEIY